MRVSRIGIVLLTTLFSSVLSHASLPPLSKGEKVVFSEDFADNRHRWTNVSVVNGSGPESIGQAAIARSIWSPSQPGDNGQFSSQAVLPGPVRLAEGSISVYVRARVDDPSSVEGSRFSFTLDENEGNRFVGILIRPRANTFIQYREAAGKGQSTSVDRVVFRDAATFEHFKLTLSAGVTPDGPATAEAFRYDADASAYVSLGEAFGAVALSTRVFNSLTLYTRNGHAVHIDAIVVTQTQK